ncbi:MAG: tyrosine-type recombinase/integrase [Planctomycetota bacterium]|jgi:integrase
MKDGAARETVNNDLGAVSVLATFCLDSGLIPSRPKIKRFKTKVRIRYLEPDQVRLYMAALRQPFRPLFQLLIGSGMRLGEAESLRACDLRLGDDENRAIIEHSKTVSGRRVAFLPVWVAGALTEHIEARELGGTDRLFTMPRRTVQKEHQRASKIAGIHDYTIHDHRHTAAVHLARAGLPIQLLQKQLGHATIAQTMRYADFHPQYSDLGSYFETVEETFGLAQTPHFSPHLKETLE